MSSPTVACPRCQEAVDELQFVPPAMMSPAVLDEIGASDRTLAHDGGLEICADCLSAITGG